MSNWLGQRSGVLLGDSAFYSCLLKDNRDSESTWTKRLLAKKQRVIVHLKVLTGNCSHFLGRGGLGGESGPQSCCLKFKKAKNRRSVILSQHPVT